MEKGDNFLFLLLCVDKLLIHTYRLRFIPEGVAETSHIFLRDAHYQNYLAMRIDISQMR
jgi:hypothetical protein